MNIYEFGHGLAICQERVAKVDTKYPTVNGKIPPRYYWID